MLFVKVFKVLKKQKTQLATYTYLQALSKLFDALSLDIPRLGFHALIPWKHSAPSQSQYGVREPMERKNKSGKTLSYLTVRSSLVNTRSEASATARCSLSSSPSRCSLRSRNFAQSCTMLAMRWSVARDIIVALRAEAIEDGGSLGGKLVEEHHFKLH